MPQDPQKMLLAQLNRSSWTDAQQAKLHRDNSRALMEKSCDPLLPPDDQKWYAEASLREGEKSDKSAKWVRIGTATIGVFVVGGIVYAFTRKGGIPKLPSENIKKLP